MALKAPPDPRRFNIQVNTDNMTSQQVLETGSGRDPILCACAREIWLFAACNSTTVIICHKPGKELVFADALSRMPFDTAAQETAAKFINKTDTCLVTIF